MFNLPKDSWIALGVLAAIVVGTVTVVYLPHDRQIEELRTRITTMKQDLEADSQAATVLPAMVRQIRAMETRYEDFDRALPGTVDLGAFLSDITARLDRERLLDRSIEPGDPSEEDLFHTLPIHMKFKGTYMSLARFLTQLHDMQRLTRVRRLKVLRGDKGDGTLDIELQLNIYFTQS